VRLRLTKTWVVSSQVCNIKIPSHVGIQGTIPEAAGCLAPGMHKGHQLFVLSAKRPGLPTCISRDISMRFCHNNMAETLHINLARPFANFKIFPVIRSSLTMQRKIELQEHCTVSPINGHVSSLGLEMGLDPF
jgi:hypothetical protein